MNKSNETNFKLKKVKLNGNKVVIEYSETIINKKGNKETFEKTCQSETCIPHEDLINAVGLLREYLMRSMRYFEFYELAMNHAGTPKDKQKVVDMFLDLTQDVTVTGISLSGTGDFASLVITGKIKNQMNGQSAINSPKITLKGEFLGYEDVVANLADTIGAECHAYIYQNKKAVKDLFDAPEVETKKETKKKASA
jgi:hypothetical protein